MTADGETRADRVAYEPGDAGEVTLTSRTAEDAGAAVTNRTPTEQPTASNERIVTPFPR